jgi:hypothetical protein
MEDVFLTYSVGIGDPNLFVTRFDTKLLRVGCEKDEYSTTIETRANAGFEMCTIYSSHEHMTHREETWMKRTMIVA